MNELIAARRQLSDLLSRARTLQHQVDTAMNYVVDLSPQEAAGLSAVGETLEEVITTLEKGV